MISREAHEPCRCFKSKQVSSLASQSDTEKDLMVQSPPPSACLLTVDKL